ncbi:MAG: hypothetical protein ACJA1U_001589 [Bermanella sp.]|jgi:hypothetical protein
MKRIFKKMACLSIMLTALCAHGFEQTLTFTEAQLQEKLQAMTPIERQTLFANVVLTDAKLRLLDAQNQLSVTAFLDVTALGGLRGSGHVTVQGSVMYQPSEGAFYLHNAQLVELHVEQLSKETINQLKPVLQDVIAQSLQSQPIYRLKDNDMRQALVKASLKKVEVKDQALLVTLGF